MKNVLFINRSRLAYNLFSLACDMIPLKIRLTQACDLPQALKLLQTTKFRLFVMDSNILQNEEDFKTLTALSTLTLPKTKKTFFYSRHFDLNSMDLSFFDNRFLKPLMPEDLTQHLIPWLKN